MSTDIFEPGSSSIPTPPPGGLGRRLRQGMFWSLAGTIISRGVSLVAGIVVARLIGKEDFGALAMIQSSISLFALFAGFGIGYVATRAVAQYRVTDVERAGRVIGMVTRFSWMSCILIALVMALLTPWLAEAILGKADLIPLLYLGAAILFFEALNEAQFGILSGFESFAVIARSNLIASLIQVTLQIVGVLLFDLAGALIGILCARLCSWVLNRWYIVRESRRLGIVRQTQGMMRELPLIVSLGVPNLLSGIIIGPVSWAAGALLVNQHGGYGEMGIFRAAQFLFIAFMLVGRYISVPLLPIIVSLAGEDRKRAEKASVLITWAIALVPTLPFILFPDIVMHLYGADFAGPSFHLTLSLVMLFTCIFLFGLGFGTITLANDMNWRNMIANAVWGVGLIVSYLYFLPYGAVGMALAHLVAYGLNTLFLLAVAAHGGLIPEGTVFSIRSLSVWILLIGCFLAGAFVADALIRLLALVAALAWIGFVLWRMLSSVRSTPDLV